MNLDSVTPLILTFNEEANIGRTLACLPWAKRIVVVDSQSTDRTLELCGMYPQVEVFTRPFDDHASQWNFGMSQVQTPWVLSLDADYLVTGELRDEIEGLSDERAITGYFISFEFLIYGQALKTSILPPRCALFQRAQAEYVNDGHTQLLELRGESGCFANPLLHDDRKPFARWLRSQVRYADLESQKLRATHWASLSLVDRLRKLVIPAPLIIIPYCLIVRGGVRDGWRGIHYALQRFIAEFLLSYSFCRSLLFSRSPQPERPQQ